MMSVLLLLILVFVPSDRIELSLLVMLVGVALFAAVALKSRVESPDYFEIIFPISVFYFFSFCFRGVVLIVNPADLNTEVNGFNALNKALGFGLLGLISIWLGYYCLSFTPGKHITALVNKLLPDEWRADKAIARILFLFILGTSIQIIVIFLGLARNSNAVVGLSAAAILFGIADSLPLIGLILFSLFVFRRRASEGKMLLIIIVWCGMLLSQALLSLVIGTRSGILFTLFLVPVVSYNYARKHLSAKQLALFAMILLVVLLVVVMPLASPLRDIRIKRFSGSISEYLQTVLQRPSNKTFLDRFYEFSQRQILLENFAIAISKTPDSIPYKNGGTFLSAASNFIPRFLWSNKVAYNFDSVFSTEYAGWLSTEGGSVVTGATVIGELYINFGIIGVVIGMFLIGLLCKSIYKNLIGTQAVGDLKILAYYFILMSLVWSEVSLGTLLFNVTTRTVIVIAVALFLRINVGMHNGIEADDMKSSLPR